MSFHQLGNVAFSIVAELAQNALCRGATERLINHKESSFPGSTAPVGKMRPRLLEYLRRSRPQLRRLGEEQRR